MKKLTKLSAVVGGLACAIALTAAASAADPIVAWDFGNPDDATLYNEDGTVAFNMNNIDGVYDETDGSMNGTILGGDPYMSIPSRGDFPAENCYMRVKYNLSGLTDWGTSVYFTTDTVSWSEDGHWRGIYDGDDDEWCEQTFYMTECPAWAGTITNLRLDIFDNGFDGQVAKVAYVAVFGSEEDANNFDYAAWHAAGSPTQLSAGGDAATATETETAAEAADAEYPAAAYPSSGTEVPDGSVLIAGALLGSEVGWGDKAETARHAAFDGDVTTFFDPPTASVDYCGIDAGEPMILTKILIHPRADQLIRFNGATIEASNDPDFEDSVELFISVEVATEDAWYDVTDEIETADNTGYRYFRYINYTEHGDVAEVELYGKAVDGTNPVYGAAAPAEEAPAEVEAAPAAETPAEEAPVEETVEEATIVEEAPAETETESAETGDVIAIVAVLAAAVSACGTVISKKRR